MLLFSPERTFMLERSEVHDFFLLQKDKKYVTFLLSFFTRMSFHARKIRNTWLFFPFPEWAFTSERSDIHNLFFFFLSFFSRKIRYTKPFFFFFSLFFLQKDQKYMAFFPLRKSFHARKIRSTWPFFFLLQKELSRQKDQKKRLQQQIKTKKER